MKVLKKIWSIVSTILVVLVVLCAVFLMGSRLIGYQVFTVLSGSMEPAYYPGDLLYVKEVPIADIKVGDPLTFVLNEDLVVATHRVIEIKTITDDEGQRATYFLTKGDNNETADNEPVHEKNVIGVPQFHIPKLGYVSDFVQHPPGLYITLAVGVILIILVFLPDMFGKKKEVAAANAENAKMAEELAELKAQLEAEKAALQVAETASEAEKAADEAE